MSSDETCPVDRYTALRFIQIFQKHLLQRSVKGGTVLRGEWAQEEHAWNILFSNQKKKQKTKFHSKYTQRSVLNRSVRPHITTQLIKCLKVPQCVT